MGRVINSDSTVEAKESKRSQWEIDEDVRAVKRAIEVFKDPERLEDVKECIAKERNVEKSMDALLDGDLSKALGLG